MHVIFNFIAKQYKYNVGYIYLWQSVRRRKTCQKFWVFGELATTAVIEWCEVERKPMRNRRGASSVE